MKNTLFALTGVLMIHTGVFAHAGHGALESDLLHYLLSPDHLFPAVIILVVATALVFRKRLARVMARNKKH